MSSPISSRHVVALYCFTALMVWSMVWHAGLAPNPQLHVAQNLLLAVSPALIPGVMSFISLRGALLGIGFAAMLMFCHAVMSAWATPNWLAWPSILLAVGTVAALGGRQGPKTPPTP